MNWDAIAFDWNQTRAFLAVMEEGSFSAAARALGQTQPTLSRQIAALEQEWGVTLFERSSRSMEPTLAALELLEHVRTMADAATKISLSASGRATSIVGKVTLTSTNLMATYFLPPILKKIQKLAPQIEVELIPSNDNRDLRKREADIAIRHGLPDHDELLTRKVGETLGRLYASAEFLQEHEFPLCADEVSKLPFIGSEENERALPYLNAMGLSLTLENFRHSTPSGTVMIALAQQGLGIVPLTGDVAPLFPDLKLVLPDANPIAIPVWLVTHRELKTSAKIRLVFDVVAEELARIYNREASSGHS